MSYTMRLSDGSILAEVYDRTIDKDTLSIALVGRGSINYGTDIGEDLIHMLENFSSPKSPKNPLYGQIWFDKAQNRMKYYAGIWKPFDGDATSLNIPNTVVKRDNAGSFEANVITANLKGIADTSKKWLTPRRLTILGDASGAVVFDGSSDVAMNLTLGKSGSSDKLATARTILLGNQLTGSTTFDGSANVVLLAGFKAGGIDTDLNGNATTASGFRTPRQLTLSGDITGSGTINGTSDTLIGAVLANTGVTPGIYNVVQVDAKGRVVGARNDDYSHAKTADYATKAGYADEAGHAKTADYAAEAGHAQRADYADNAGHANYADEAGKLRPGRVINIAGTVTGAAFFDGSNDITINVVGNGIDGSAGAQGPQGPQGPKGDTGPQGPQGPQGPAGSSAAAGTNSSIESRYQAEGVTITCPPGAGYDPVSNTQVIAQWDIDLSGYNNYIVEASQFGGFNMNGLHGETRFAVGKTELLIDGQLVDTATNQQTGSIGVATGATTSALTFFGVVPSSKRITIRCSGTVGGKGYDSYSYTFGASKLQVMRFA